jgi:hypothetical protein
MACSRQVCGNGRAITMAMLANPIVADSSITPAVFGLVGVLIGGFIAGAVSLWVAKQAREAAERAWIRDNRREIYDRFLTCAQTLLIACEAAQESKTERAGATVKAAHTKFFEAYGVVQTVAENALVAAARVYAYRLLELKDILDSTSFMGSGNFEAVAQLVRRARHNTIDAMRPELGLAGSARPEENYNPFVGTDLAEEYAQSKRPRPESQISGKGCAPGVKCWVAG